MSIEPAGKLAAARDAAVPPDECLEFVRFCYRRRSVSWPDLYDEMAAVAARGAFRGLGFAELAERGVCFSLNDLPRFAALTQRVMLEERSSREPQLERRDEANGRLTLAHVRG